MTVRTIVKSVTVGTPVRRVTSGAFTINNLAGVNLTGVTDGSMLVYNSASQEFQSKINIDNPNTNFDGGNF